MQLISLSAISNCSLLIKQGVTEEQVANLRERLVVFKKERSVLVDSIFDHHHRCPKKLTHKVKAQNVLVSEPTELTDSSYKSVLMIDERCADLSDHVTGIHLQGMVLMEASRQFTTAVLEKFFINRFVKSKIKMVMGEFQSNFHRYAFPMDAEFNLKIVKDRKINNNNRMFTVLISIFQNGETIAEINRKVSMFDSNLIDYKEKIAMEDCVGSILSSNVTAINPVTIEVSHARAA
jgi:hypothetical protein